VLDTLSYDVTFPTGRRFQRNLTFTAGMTAIIGPNEHGKSLTLELIRFCLFGTEALRGSADDYKKMQAALTFTVRGIRYGVIRGSKVCSFGVDGEDPSCRGTKPVNAAILALLGFDLSVFDIACAANQGDFDGLSRLRPAARREMVDKLIGADRIEEIVSWTGDQALGLKRELDVLERGLVEPVEPAKPEGWMPARELAERISAKQEARDQVVRIEAWLENEPEAVLAPELPHKISEAALDAGEAILQRPVIDYDPIAVSIQWCDYDRWQRREAFLRQHPRPLVGVTEAYADGELEIRRLDQELAQLEKAPKLCCPECDHTFTLADDQVSSVLTDRLKLIASRGDLEFEGDVNWLHQRAFARDWAQPGREAEWAKLKDAAETAKPTVSRDRLDDTNSIAPNIRESELSKLGMPGASLAVLRRLRQELATYHAQKAAAAASNARRRTWLDTAPAMREALQENQGKAAGLAEDRALLSAVASYDMQAQRYQEDLRSYTTRVAEVDQKRTERASWLAGKEQLNALRVKLKSYLAPSLSIAASALLSQMTRGARTSIFVDETFEITVDGQKLQTLSGSGKVCANLALRIGLGQVLTNNVLSVFIGDEMDAFMDQERVAALNESLERLLPRIKQVVLITHKHPTCSNIIDFGK
jgi:DNA repair exonuclease SbcCD ATPase subunit